MKYDIVGVGYNCLDHLCSIESYPPEDGSTHITGMQTQGGGSSATAVAAASRMGRRTAFIGRLGFDAASDDIIRRLQAEGVDTSHLIRTEGITGLQSFIMVDPSSGSRTKFPTLDTTPAIVWTEELKDVIASSRILHLDGTHNANAVAAAAIAKEKGTLVSLDGCHLKEDNSLNLALAKSADILIMNYRYPLRVTGLSDYDEALLACAEWGARVVIGTLGDQGCRAVIDGRVERFPAFKVKPVDTTGAGDVFHGAFLAAYAAGRDLRDCIVFASAAAAIKCTFPGGREGIRSEEEILEFIRSRQ